MKTTPNAHAFFINLVVGYRSAKVVQVAHSLGVFSHLETPLTAEEVSSRIQGDPHNTLCLLKALAALELLVCEAGRFHNGPLASKHLVPGNPGYLGANLKYQELLWEGWSKLEQTVKTGEPLAGLVERLSDKDFSREYLRSVNNASQASAHELVRAFDGFPPERMLDVGGGLGTYCAVFAERFPKLTATLLDLPETVEQARTALEKNPARGRVELRAGNYHQADFGSGYDLVLISHVTHDEPADKNVNLFKKAYQALRPGGRLAIHDFITQPDGCGPLFATLFSVNMLVYTRGGQVYSEPEYVQMMETAGFERFSSLPILADRPDSGTRLIVGVKGKE